MKRGTNGFTLIELMVVIGILAILLSFLLPVLGKARRQAQNLVSMNHQRQIAASLLLYACDNCDRYPESVATIGHGKNWNWQEPCMITGYEKRAPQLHRAMSGYLREYVEKAAILNCPTSPNPCPRLEEVWQAGDEWDHPDTAVSWDPLSGCYCFYWNYLGILEMNGDFRLFRGPQDSWGGGRGSTLLLSDYLGYNHWRSPGAYGSCQKFSQAEVTQGSQVSSDYWSCPKSGGVSSLHISLLAGFADGHVETYTSDQVVPMRVSLSSDGAIPYPDKVGPGIFYLPASAIH